MPRCRTRALSRSRSARAAVASSRRDRRPFSERDADLPGERLEQREVGGLEGGGRAQPVADQQGAERPRVAAQRGGQHVVQHVPVGPGDGRVEPHQLRRRRLQGAVQEAVEVLVRLLVHPVAVRGGGDDEDALPVGRARHRELRELGAQRLAGALQDPADARGEVGRLVQHARRVVQELQAVALLPLADVAVQGDQDGADRDDEQPGGDRVLAAEADAHQARGSCLRWSSAGPAPSCSGNRASSKRPSASRMASTIAPVDRQELTTAASSVAAQLTGSKPGIAPATASNRSTARHAPSPK